MDVERDRLNLTPSPRLLAVIGDVDLTVTQCLAELADNSFDELNAASQDDATFSGAVHIEVPTSRVDPRQAEIVVSDNGRGMSLVQLETALRAGSSGNSRYGTLGLFGMGFNIATARLGNVTEVWTTRADDDAWLVVTIDLQEMQRAESFDVPVMAREKQPGEHGTKVVVKSLKPEIYQSLTPTRTLSKLKNELGDVYSYLLREPVVEDTAPKDEPFSGARVMGGAGLRLFINRQRVTPLLPCVWDPERTVTKSGRDISAVQIIDRPLSEAWACMACGFWHRSEVSACEECGSLDVERRARVIKGWLGIQRYSDSSDFGVDVLRQGRKILIRSKEFFKWYNPDEIASDGELEYPVELGVGRIVGEIHLDHVKVNYRKTDFERETGVDWKTAVETIRGAGPLKPQRARGLNYQENDSPMGLLFTGFRRSDPGTKCLVPGNGREALHDAARKWGKRFRQGELELQLDTYWYAAAVQHDAIVNGDKSTGDLDADTLKALIDAGLSDLAPATEDDATDGPETDAATSSEVGDEQPAPETDAERFDRYRRHAQPVVGMDAEVQVRGHGSTHLRVYQVSGTEIAKSGRQQATVGRLNVGDLEIYVDADHELVTDFGKEVRDLALLEAAATLAVYYAVPMEDLSFLYGELTKQFADQRVTSVALRARCEELVERMRENVAAVARREPNTLWDALTADEKMSSQEIASSGDRRIDWQAAVANGDFADYLPITAVASLADQLPQLLFDGAVFISTWSTWDSDVAKARQVDRVVRLLAEVDVLVSEGPGGPGSQDVRRNRITVDDFQRELAQQ